MNPFDEHEGVKGVKNAVDEVHVPLGADVISAEDKRDHGQSRDKLHQHQGIEADGDQEKGDKETAEGKLQLPDKEVHDGQQAVPAAGSV